MALEERTGDPDLWSDPQNAQDLLQQLSALKADIAPALDLVSRSEDLAGMMEMAEAEQDTSMQQDFEAELHELQQAIDKLETATLLSGEYDSANAILSINAGAGGTESCDWAS
ncbi:MAG TPA: PCRF domain-containing protein, partial [Armatimonadota bacterium]|nr:PCRF domain-containing protein [Armatimonadota bacterium]